MEAVNSKKVDQTQKVAQLSLSELRERAIGFHKNGDLQQAINNYKFCLKINPNDVGIWNNLGAALRKQKHYQSAVNFFITHNFHYFNTLYNTIIFQ